MTTVVVVTEMVTAARENDGAAMTREEKEGGVDFLFFPSAASRLDHSS